MDPIGSSGRQTGDAISVWEKSPGEPLLGILLFATAKHECYVLIEPANTKSIEEVPLLSGVKLNLYLNLTQALVKHIS